MRKPIYGDRAMYTCTILFLLFTNMLQQPYLDRWIDCLNVQCVMGIVSKTGHSLALNFWSILCGRHCLLSLINYSFLFFASVNFFGTFSLSLMMQNTANTLRILKKSPWWPTDRFILVGLSEKWNNKTNEPINVPVVLNSSHFR